MDSHQIVFNQGKIQTMDLLGVSVPIYTFFVLLGLVVGGLTLFLLNRRLPDDGDRVDHSFIVIAAALFGGILGAKLPIWILYGAAIFNGGFNLSAFLSGRTILGGLIGGTLAVIAVKRFFGIKRRTGNQLAPAIAIGMAIGRLGCFFQGCCAGITTAFPWGVDFGDGLMRHPTQLYEVLFHGVAFIYLWRHPKTKVEGGSLLTQYFMAYFVFRFVTEWLRMNPHMVLMLTVYQWLCLLGLGFMALKAKRQKDSNANKD